MAEKTIAVKLNPLLEQEKRGLCDPEDKRNSEVITSLNYGNQGYLRVYPSRFIQAQIQSGVLVRVSEQNARGSDRVRSGEPPRRGAKPRRTPGEAKR